MAYQVLARKWRPRTFHEMVGQAHVLKALIHALDKNRLHHAYLFTGTRGVGKTTIGRILARCLSCEQGVTASPCGECINCQEILQGRFVDLIEIDAASRTKVDDMRELLENVQYAPTRGRFKIYLIDEVHMLSNASFNALLKTLEEPPDHVKFLFATTDPQKLPVTILSRCLQFNLSRMTAERIVEHLRNVLTDEQITYAEDALWLIARAADGSMRDALSLTDQAIAYCDEQLDADLVGTMLGTVNQQAQQRLVDALVADDAAALKACIDDIAAWSPDYAAVLADLLSLFHRIAIEQAVPDSVDNSQGDANRVKALAGQLSAEDVQLFYQTILVGRKDLAITPDARMGFEMTLLRMLAFRPAPYHAQRPHTQRSQAQIPQTQGPALVETRQPVAAAPISPAVVNPPAVQPDKAQVVVEPVAVAEPAAADTASMQAPQSHWDEQVPLDQYATDLAALAASDEDSPELSQAIPTAPPSPAPSSEHPSEEARAHQIDETAEKKTAEILTPPHKPSACEPEPDPDQFVWVRDFPQLALAGMARSLAQQGALLQDGATYRLILEEGQYRLLTDKHRAQISQALCLRLGQETRLQIEIGDPGMDSPTRWAAQVKLEKQAQAESAIAGDAKMKAILDAFQGQVIPESIHPLTSYL